MTYRNTIKFTTIVAIGLFITSLTQEAFCTTGDCKKGIMVLLVGWMGILTELGAIASVLIDNGSTSIFKSGFGSTFTWLANPLIIFSLIMLRVNSKSSLKISIISTLIILSFMLFGKVINNEAGSYSQVTDLSIGYWLWLLSSVTVVIGSFLLNKLNSDLEDNKNGL